MAPVISSISPSQGPASGGTSVTISGSGFTGATTVRFGTVSVPFTLVSASQITATAPAGSGSVNVTVVTPLGTSNGVPYNYNPVPVISGVSPGQGPTAGGNSVTITGSGFTGATSVKFGAVSASFTVLSDTQITATAPAGSGSVNVTVVTPLGTSNGAAYLYVTVPLITSLTPSQGPTSGGNAVTITGSGFTGATSVKFGNASAAITGNTGAQVTVTAPAGAAAPVNVTVVAPGGSSGPVPYYYIPAPAVTSADPSQGPAAGGNTVIITGSNLQLTSAVSFGTGMATGISVLSDNLITAHAPSGSGTVAVSVTTPGGTSLPGLGSAYYTYLGFPVVNSLTPSQGSAQGGDIVTIRGSNLTYTDDVRFGGIPASFTTVSDTEVVAVTPGGAPGTTGVVVHTPGGTSTGVPYLYVA